MSNENNCPSCGTPDAYIGIMFVECANSNCDLYTENQAHIVRQQKIAEIKIREQQGEKEDLREEKRKLVINFTMRPATKKGISANLIKNSKFVFQTTLSERFIKTN